MVQFYSIGLISLSTQMRNHYKSVNDNGLYGMKTLPVHWEEPRWVAELHYPWGDGSEWCHPGGLTTRCMRLMLMLVDKYSFQIWSKVTWNFLLIFKHASISNCWTFCYIFRLKIKLLFKSTFNFVSLLVSKFHISASASNFKKFQWISYSILASIFQICLFLGEGDETQRFDREST